MVGVYSASISRYGNLPLGTMNLYSFTSSVLGGHLRLDGVCFTASVAEEDPTDVSSSCCKEGMS